MAISRMHIIIGIILLFLGLIFLIFKDRYRYYFTSSKSTDALVFIPNQGNTEAITIDFANCSPGGSTVYFGQGSTYFLFEGIKKGNCIFSYSIEVEMGRGNKVKCEVPVSLSKQTFANNFGVDLKTIENYCILPQR